MKDKVVDYGDIQPIYNICGDHPLFGPSQCPDCKKVGPEKFCGKYFIVAIIHTNPPEEKEIA